MTNFSLKSNSFENNGIIPRNFGYKEGNSSPSLEFLSVPSETKSLALIMDDPDAMGAVGKVWVHWVVWNINPNDKFEENSIPPHCLQGETDFGEVGYGGPAPPDKEHTYIFTIYALSDTIEAKSGSSKSEILEQIKNITLDKAVLKGRFSP